ncbi:hypothetical protein LPTSP3_g06130 [Leptospira kobayashii]|uniref:Uncharacterized protein n=1 Tax=Leptospira kobayashii TaxID=1917830 RepID=A0ABM7UGR8_9LEPT|nr:hypothetical protein LPTSP3_g06130 [Leptospira kobayashii]
MEGFVFFKKNRKFVQPVSSYRKLIFLFPIQSPKIDALNQATDSAKNLVDIASELEKAKNEIKNKDISDLDLPEGSFF